MGWQEQKDKTRHDSVALNSQHSVARYFETRCIGSMHDTRNA